MPILLMFTPLEQAGELPSAADNPGKRTAVVRRGTFSLKRRFSRIIRLTGPAGTAVFIRGSSNGRTEAFEAFYRGSTPCPRTTLLNA
jgi:hypothetical protein